RDADTHYAVPAQITFDGPRMLSVITDETGSVRTSLPAGQYRVTITAQGYQAMRTLTYATAGKSSGETVMLTPDQVPQEQTAEVLNSRLRDDYTLVDGYIVDVDTGKPLPGVRVSLEKAGAEGFTDDRGYYYMSVPTPALAEESAFGFDTLTAQLHGYNTILRRNMQIGGDNVGLILDMQHGKG